MDTMTALRFLGDVHAIDPKSSETFAVRNMSEVAREKFVRARATQVIRESGGPAWMGVPTETTGTAELMDHARNVAEARDRSPQEQLRASGVPLKSGREPLVADEVSEQVRWLHEVGAVGSDDALREFAAMPTDGRAHVMREVARRAPAGTTLRRGQDVMRESGVAIRGERHRTHATPAGPAVGAHDALRAAGVPMRKPESRLTVREASAASSAGQVERISSTGSQERDPAPDVAPCPDCAQTGIEQTSGENCRRCDGDGFIESARQRISDGSVVGEKFPPLDPDDDDQVRESAHASLIGARVPLKAGR